MLAIIIPYYKFTFFEATLQSLAKQTCQNFKVYIGNDASPEDPSMLLEKYKGKFDFVYHRFETNLGGAALTKQWERCIALSGNEEWIMILGDDDVLGDNVVEAFYENLPEIEQEGSNVVRFATQVIDEITNSTSKVFVNPKFEKAVDFYCRRDLGLVRCSLSEHIFRKKSYLNYSFQDYPLAWHSDDYAWIQFAENKPIFAINNEKVWIRVSNESLTGSTTNLKDKRIAESMFYMDLVKHNLNLFKRGTRFQFLMKAEVSIKKYRKLSLKEWHILFLKYVQNFKFIPFFKFTRRFLKSF
ncbi:glycosyltransferase family 2 protein [Flavobacterium aquiphilum]|uniref:glycosyltransferase family 2 protein n=1 Tax=Flavobacterium aquiphilum TaxID=3003261 RepID=UPI002480BA70|nr:glycosyltransferase family 2 protein [Flavobacterium aquiphilum]